MFEERNQSGCNRHHLTCRNVHEVDFVSWDQVRFTATTHGASKDELFFELLVFGQRGVSLRDVEFQFVVSCEVLRLISDNTVFNLAVRSLNETERVDAGVGRKRTDQTNVGAFRGFNGAHTAVVRRVNVTHVHTCAVT